MWTGLTAGGNEQGRQPAMHSLHPFLLSSPGPIAKAATLTRLPQGDHLPPYVLHAPALLLAAREGHHAVAALFVAAVNHVDPGGEVGLAARHRDVLLHGHQVRGAHLRGRARVWGGRGGGHPGC